MRLAQRTYRQKKDTAISDLHDQVTLLESILSGTEVIFRDLYELGIAAAVREGNHTMMQSFAAAGMKFERLMAKKESRPTHTSQTDTHLAGPRKAASEKGHDNSESDSTSTLPNTAPLAASTASKSLSSSLTNPENGFIEGFPQDLISKHTEPDGRNSSTSQYAHAESTLIPKSRKTINFSSTNHNSSFLENLADTTSKAAALLPLPSVDLLRNMQIPTEFAFQPLDLEGSRITEAEARTPSYLFGSHLSPMSSSEATPAASTSLSPNFIGGSNTSNSSRLVSLLRPEIMDNDFLLETSQMHAQETLEDAVLERAELRRLAALLLDGTIKSAITVDSIPESIAEQIFRLCLLYLLDCYVKERYKELERVFSKEFRKNERLNMARVITSVRLGLRCTNYDRLDRVDDDSLFPGYCSPFSVERLFHEAQEAGARLDESRFVRLVCRQAYSIGNLPRIAYSDIQSALVLSTIF